ncbi:MAG: hypothetical protein LBL07_17740, partial [Tannerella sp.]|nr:hypothetical protein [Tannerella sp.]
MSVANYVHDGRESHRDDISAANTTSTAVKNPIGIACWGGEGFWQKKGNYWVFVIFFGFYWVQFKLSHCPKSITYARIKKIISNDKGRIFSHGGQSIRGNR